MAKKQEHNGRLPSFLTVTFINILLLHSTDYRIDMLYQEFIGYLEHNYKKLIVFEAFSKNHSRYLF